MCANVGLCCALCACWVKCAMCIVCHCNVRAFSLMFQIAIRSVLDARKSKYLRQHNSSWMVN